MEHEGVECCGRGRFHPPPPLRLRGHTGHLKIKGKPKKSTKVSLFIRSLQIFAAEREPAEALGSHFPVL